MLRDRSNNKHSPTDMRKACSGNDEKGRKGGREEDNMLRDVATTNTARQTQGRHAVVTEGRWTAIAKQKGWQRAMNTRAGKRVEGPCGILWGRE